MKEWEGTTHRFIPSIHPSPPAQDDPYWDDDEEEWPDYGAIDGEDEQDAAAREYERMYAVPEEDGPIMHGMKDWVDAIIADLGVCPFTVSAAKAGA